jgi:hypothetical protein
MILFDAGSGADGLPQLSHGASMMLGRLALAVPRRAGVWPLPLGDSISQQALRLISECLRYLTGQTVHEATALSKG